MTKVFQPCDGCSLRKKQSRIWRCRNSVYDFLARQERKFTMAQRVVTLFTDDITGEEGEDIATHAFGVDGVSYEIDLGADSYQNLLDALGPYISAGRKTGSAKRGSAKRGPAAIGSDAGKIREWAREQGIEVSPRGRVPQDVRDKYTAAH